MSIKEQILALADEVQCPIERAMKWLRFEVNFTGDAVMLHVWDFTTGNNVKDIPLARIVSPEINESDLGWEDEIKLLEIARAEFAQWADRCRKKIAKHKKALAKEIAGEQRLPQSHSGISSKAKKNSRPG